MRFLMAKKRDSSFSFPLCVLIISGYGIPHRAELWKQSVLIPAPPRSHFPYTRPEKPFSNKHNVVALGLPGPIRAVNVTVVVSSRRPVGRLVAGGIPRPDVFCDKDHDLPQLSLFETASMETSRPRLEPK